ncbi:hypothetical protein AB0G02_19840 [Actinosynnema sp. NPDC023658]|uniref:hypothetical protein n=1 Tax=Actinosynnema sp. NPDC023658 TaxID=3155465 RepID=UPI0033C1762D
MTDSFPVAVESEDDYYAQAEQLGAARDHADRVLHGAVRDGGRGESDNPYRLAYLQLVAELNENPK